MSGNLLLIYICIFHVLSRLLLIYICKLHWNFRKAVQSFLTEKEAVLDNMTKSEVVIAKEAEEQRQRAARAENGKFLLIYIYNFHVLSHLLLIYICKLHWNLNTMFVCQVNDL